ncbi:hypothetical protein U1Q18_020730 [Sarracenia purpurea var. burkii]
MAPKTMSQVNEGCANQRVAARSTSSERKQALRTRRGCEPEGFETRVRVLTLSKMTGARVSKQVRNKGFVIEDEARVFWSWDKSGDSEG